MRAQVVDGGNWFDLDAATKYDPIDGSNETLYKTENGTYVLKEPVRPVREGLVGVVCKKISPDDAYRWLLKNDQFDAIPEEERDKRKI